MYLTETWRLKEQRYTLTGVRMADDKVSFPPRPVEARPVETYDFEMVEAQSRAGEPAELVEAN